jgi:hypothetical protein
MGRFTITVIVAHSSIPGSNKPSGSLHVFYCMIRVYGILLALLFFGEAEKMSPGFYVGAGIILAVVLAMPWVKRKRMRGSSRL